MKRFEIYRSNPNDPNDRPKYVSYYLDMAKTGPMFLDALIKIKDEIDPTLSFRRSCREGIARRSAPQGALESVRHCKVMPGRFEGPPV